MRFHTSSAIFFAASIALAVAVPARTYYRPASSYEDDEQGMVQARQPYTLASAPFFYQPRTLELESISNTGRKYQVVKRKKHGSRPVFPQSDEEDDDDPQDEEDDDESSEEEADEEGGGGGDGEEESLDTPGWDKLFPEDDKNTGNFDDQGGQGGQGGGGYGPQGGGGGYGPQGGGGYGAQDEGYGPQGAYGSGSLANLPTGGPAPESSGSIMNLFGMGGGSGSDESGSGGPQSDFGGGGPGQYRQGPPPRSRTRPPYQAVRSRSSLPVEEPRSGGAVLYDGYRYIPVKPVQVRIPQRQSKKVSKQNVQARTLKTSSKPTTSTRPRQNKKLPSKKQQQRPQPQYVLVPMDRDGREIRFGRDQHGFRMEHGPMYSPTEIWRWEGPGGRPLRRRENRPAYYSSRPHNRGSTVRFAEENDY